MTERTITLIRINQLKISPEVSLDEVQLDFALKGKISKALRLKGESFSYKIIKKSVDSRHKPDIFIVYSVDVTVYNVAGKAIDGSTEEKLIKSVNNNNIMLSKTVKYTEPKSVRSRDGMRPVIVGFGPAGMFCSLMLARAGYRPIVIERGEAVDDRMKSVNDFWNGGKLNTESNAQFGEGGAGTFSDGKLNTQVKEVYGRISKVLEIFVEHGADDSIVYDAKPHIGTDRLVNIVRSIRKEIESLGGEVRFNTKLVDIEIEECMDTNGGTGNIGKKVGNVVVQTSEKSTVKNENNRLEIIPCDCLVLAIGHSARDTFYMLKDKLAMEQKAFAVGLRIEHKQELINIHEFGDGKYKNYMPASYKLTHKASNGRGVYSFCMCPGGYVVNASSEEGRLAVNGMSYSGRDSGNANSALIVTVDGKDFGSDDVLAGIEFQRRLEKKAYELGGGKIPVQRFGDFKDNKPTDEETLAGNSVKPCIKGAYKADNLRELLPDALCDALVEGVTSFDRQIHGYADPDAVFAGVESRTSSPVRISRDENLQAFGINGIYPCGEGAGYAGGITSAAVDGIKVYEAIVRG